MIQKIILKVLVCSLLKTELSFLRYQIFMKMAILQPFRHFEACFGLVHVQG